MELHTNNYVWRVDTNSSDEAVAVTDGECLERETQLRESVGSQEEGRGSGHL